MTNEQKTWIDEADYVSLLRKWRFSSSGEPMFEGECGEYYAKVMFAKRDANPEAAVQASKYIGW